MKLFNNSYDVLVTPYKLGIIGSGLLTSIILKRKVMEGDVIHFKQTGSKLFTSLVIVTHVVSHYEDAGLAKGCSLVLFRRVDEVGPIYDRFKQEIEKAQRANEGLEQKLGEAQTQLAVARRHIKKTIKPVAVAQ